jgi:pyrroline-5-carboxylate reductase
MTTKSIGFVGGGRIARILLAGWSRAGCCPRDVRVSDPNEATLRQLQQQFPAIEVFPSDNAATVSQQVVFFAVHPPVLAETLRGIRGSLREDALLVSLAPKFTTAKISELLGGFGRVARSIPNAPSLVNQGYNPLCFAPGVGESERAEILTLFEPLGACPVVEERKLEAYAILTAMGPTYFWPQFFELSDLSQEFGLSEPEASAGLCAMVAGSLAMLTDSGLRSQHLLDLIPVKPLGEEQPLLRDAYRRRLTEIYQKISP